MKFIDFVKSRFRAVDRLNVLGYIPDDVILVSIPGRPSLGDRL